MAEMQFTETALLLAFMEEDHDRALELAAGMLPNERRTLVEQAGAMATLLDSFCDACDQPIPPGGAEEGVPWGQTRDHRVEDVDRGAPPVPPGVRPRGHEPPAPPPLLNPRPPGAPRAGRPWPASPSAVPPTRTDPAMPCSLTRRSPRAALAAVVTRVMYPVLYVLALVTPAPALGALVAYLPLDPDPEDVQNPLF
jgi:hypothetical protein